MPILGAPEVMASSERQRWFDPGGGGSTHGGVLGVQTRTIPYVCINAMRQSTKSGVMPIEGTNAASVVGMNAASVVGTNPASVVGTNAASVVPLTRRHTQEYQHAVTPMCKPMYRSLCMPARQDPFSNLYR